MSALPRYDGYKDANSPWLRKVPEHWDLLPGLAVIKENKEKNQGMIESTVLSLSYGKVVVKPPEKLTGLVPESFETYQVINPGDIIIRPTDLQNDTTSLRTGLANDRGIITSAYICLRPIGNANPKYLHYLLHAYDLMKVFYGLGSGLRQNLDYRDFKRLEFVLPPTKEQERIVNFLDQKTAQIDTAISKKQRLIELLKEQKAILINRAVTVGLNQNVPMRDSGVEWIGGIPAHWQIIPNRYIFREQNERSRKGEEVHLSMSQQYGLVPAKELDVQTLQSESYEGAKLCKAGDLVQNRLKAHLAVFSVSPCDGLVSPDYSVFRIQKTSNQPMYFERLFKTPPYLAEFKRRVRGIVVGFLRLYSEDFNAIPALVPPAEEQKDIVAYIGKVSEEFANVEHKTEDEIALLQELKATTIASAVTGRLKV